MPPRKRRSWRCKYQPNIVAETKPDKSPVTRADRECERMIAGMLSDAFPDDGILGEEGARAESRSGRRWIIDPIDGTRDYVRGNPLWANLIALEAAGDVVVGVVNLPILGSCVPQAVVEGRITTALACILPPKHQSRNLFCVLTATTRWGNRPITERLLDWMGAFWAVRGLGGAADAMMVASGQAEIWIEPSASPWDFAPLKVILEEAGARYFNVDGGSTIYAGNAVGCAPGLEQEVRRFLDG